MQLIVLAAFSVARLTLLSPSGTIFFNINIKLHEPQIYSPARRYSSSNSESSESTPQSQNDERIGLKSSQMLSGRANAAGIDGEIASVTSMASPSSLKCNRLRARFKLARRCGTSFGVPQPAFRAARTSSDVGRGSDPLHALASSARSFARACGLRSAPYHCWACSA
ncbi:hypothetical protein GGX14DRAFT_481765, partial [Mycena pura]